ncbi:hypothetical protein RHMOL_Rhmol03G0044000 [Rhododendron molle]|uniref:Uncharacterized protein n=1 Tax=Rhododendron molle TaxID=49168 RepID=A0ACC0PAV1_RHOML|nr:hypothetical protein RHMOL_Rhmol03G0044000 [Rhododendron molle]
MIQIWGVNSCDACKSRFFASKRNGKIDQPCWKCTRCSKMKLKMCQHLKCLPFQLKLIWMKKIITSHGKKFVSANFATMSHVMPR